MFRDPAGHAFANFHAEIAKSVLLVTRSDGVVEFLTGLVEHQQRPHVSLDEAFHLLENCAQNRVEVEARGERSRQLMKDQQVVERNAVFGCQSHANNREEPVCILSHAGGSKVHEMVYQHAGYKCTKVS